MGHSILCLPRAKNDRRLTSESSSSREAKGVWAKNTQRVMDAYMENCVVRIKIAVSAIVAFGIAGRKTAIFQQRNRLLAPNLQRRRGRTCKCSIMSKNILADLYHLFVWTVTISTTTKLHLQTCPLA